MCVGLAQGAIHQTKKLEKLSERRDLHITITFVVLN